MKKREELLAAKIRRSKMLRCKIDGNYTITEMAELYGVTRQRISQIIILATKEANEQK